MFIDSFLQNVTINVKTDHLLFNSKLQQKLWWILILHKIRNTWTGPKVSSKRRTKITSKDRGPDIPVESMTAQGALN